MSIEGGRLYCGKCKRQYEHTADDDLALLEHAQNDDWGFDADGMDICPACQQAEGAGDMSNHDDGAHPVALKPGKMLVEAEWDGTIDKDGDCVLRTKQSEGSDIQCWADPATVHPASEMEDLRAEIAAIDFAFGNCDALQGLSLPDKASKAMSEARAAQDLRAKLAAAGTTSSKLAERIDEQIVEKRKGERRKSFSLSWSAPGGNIYRKDKRQGSNRRKVSEVVDWKARWQDAEAREAGDGLRVRLAAAEGQIREIKNALADHTEHECFLYDRCRAILARHAPVPITPEEQFEYLQSNAPAQQQAEPVTEQEQGEGKPDLLSRMYAAELRIEALEQKARA